MTLQEKERKKRVYKKIGILIRQMMEIKNIASEDLALLLGDETYTVYQYRQGRSLTVDRLYRIAHAMGESVYMLLPNDEEVYL